MSSKLVYHNVKDTLPLIGDVCSIILKDGNVVHNTIYLCSVTYGSNNPNNQIIYWYFSKGAMMYDIRHVMGWFI